ncbi:MAG TPA: hypothetical protein VG496_20190 [Myxococcales bacterium]|nr:hypothetical protein [Myxococcales bacterium]
MTGEAHWLPFTVIVAGIAAIASYWIADWLAQRHAARDAARKT